MSSAAPLLKIIAFQVVASTIDGRPVYSVADILEPKPRCNSRCLRSARLTAGPRGYVLVGRADQDLPEFNVVARRLDGLYSRPACARAA